MKKNITQPRHTNCKRCYMDIFLNISSNPFCVVMILVEIDDRIATIRQLSGLA